MLSPRYLDGLSDELVEIYSQLETDILQDMARRIKRLGKITDATKWQAQMLAEAGGLKANIAKTLKKYDKTIVEQVTKTYTEALKKNAENDSKIFVKALGHTVSAPNAQQMLATIQKCHSDLSRLTLTTAATSQTLFVQQANRVYMNVQSGAFDYDTAMKSAADAMAERGITAVQYRNGQPVTLTIESAIRMNILTSINQTAANMTLNNCEELGCDLVETSAHIGARPEHEEWQGQIFSRSGTNPKYRPFSVCELGSITGICGINCRHSFYPYFEGMHEHYTQDDLDEMAKEELVYNGHKMPRYEAEQRLRGIERNIRKYKRRALTEEAIGADNTAARVKLGEWQAKARDFTEQTGLRRDFAREYIGTKDGKQPKGVKVPTSWYRQPMENNPQEVKSKTELVSHEDYIKLKNEAIKETGITQEMREKIYTSDWSKVPDTWKKGDASPPLSNILDMYEAKFFNTATGSRNINTAMRTGDWNIKEMGIDISKRCRETHDILKSLIEKSPTKQDFLVQRYVKEDWKNALNPKVGETITDNQFVSVSLSDRNVYKDVKTHKIKLLIEVPKGSKMYVSENLMESEGVLYKPTYLVKEITKDSDDFHELIRLEMRK